MTLTRTPLSIFDSINQPAKFIFDSDISNLKIDNEARDGLEFVYRFGGQMKLNANFHPVYLNR